VTLVTGKLARETLGVYDEAHELKNWMGQDLWIMSTQQTSNDLIGSVAR